MWNGVWMKCHRSLLQVTTPCFHLSRVEARRRRLGPVWVCVSGRKSGCVLWETWPPSVCCCSADKGTLSPQRRSWAHAAVCRPQDGLYLNSSDDDHVHQLTPESRSMLPFTHHKTTFSLFYLFPVRSGCYRFMWWCLDLHLSPCFHPNVRPKWGELSKCRKNIFKCKLASFPSTGLKCRN